MKRITPYKRKTLALGLGCLLAIVATTACVLPDIEVGRPDFSSLSAGRYTGRWDTPLVKVEVAVTADNGSLTEIQILKHECGRGKPAEAIIESVLEKQSLQVDTVSGATYSSMVILRAIENALTGK